MQACKGAAAIPEHYLHLKSRNLIHASPGRPHLNTVLVVKVLDAPGIPVPIHGADAELTHPCPGEKQPKRASFTQTAGKFAWVKQSVMKKKLIRGKVDLEPSFGGKGQEMVRWPMITRINYCQADAVMI